MRAGPRLGRRPADHQLASEMPISIGLGRVLINDQPLPPGYQLTCHGRSTRKADEATVGLARGNSARTGSRHFYSITSSAAA
jgi:hypothetical protein